MECIFFFCWIFVFGVGCIDSFVELVKGVEEICVEFGCVVWKVGDCVDDVFVIVCGMLCCCIEDGLVFELGVGDFVGGFDVLG